MALRRIYQISPEYTAWLMGYGIDPRDVMAAPGFLVEKDNRYPARLFLTYVRIFRTPGGRPIMEIEGAHPAYATDELVTGVRHVTTNDFPPPHQYVEID